MSDRFTQDWISNEWQDFAYQKIKENNFNILDSYLKSPPTTILDIGCGLAWESRMFNLKYNTLLYLIDGDASNNQTKDANSKDINYHQSADTFLYYNSFRRLDDELKKLGTKDYTLIDYNNLTLPDIKFDLIRYYRLLRVPNYGKKYLHHIVISYINFQLVVMNYYNNQIPDI